MVYNHTCGYPIWIEFEWNGFSHIAVFYRAAYGPQREKIDSCPKCGETLFKRDFYFGE